jgi:hypothetical protein
VIGQPWSYPAAFVAALIIATVTSLGTIRF